MAYKTGDREQKTFLPPVIDDYVSREDPVRVYDAFVNALDFQELGIPIEQCKAGAHEYYPREMLKLFIYGYSYGIRSSRKLERACHHNLSFIWLTGGLKPDYRTISRFRSKHKKAIKKVLKQCVRTCIELDLIEGNTLFVDGSAFRGNASIKNTWTKKRCEKRLKKVDDEIDRLVEEAERIDQVEENQESLIKIKGELQDKEELEKKIKEIAATLKELSRRSHNTTDPGCVKVKSRQGTHAGYNVQIVVDKKHGLIVHGEASSRSQDANQFSEQVTKASSVLGKKPEIVSSDSGYHSLEDLEKVDEDITIVMPSQKQAQQEHGHSLGEFDKERFRYDPDKDEYICPAGKRLKYMGHNNVKGRGQYKAKGSECRGCRHFGVCTKSRNGRTVTRLDQEELMEQLKSTYQSPEGQEIYKLRGQKAELPFGHMKRNLGAGQFMLRGRAKADAEVSILSTCFNISRMITLIGIPTLILKLNGA